MIEKVPVLKSAPGTSGYLANQKLGIMISGLPLSVDAGLLVRFGLIGGLFQQKEGNILPLEPAVAPGADAVGFQYTLVAPASHRINMDIEKSSYLSYCQYGVNFILTYHFPFSIFFNCTILMILYHGSPRNRPKGLILM
jgi:hypothetical protein